MKRLICIFNVLLLIVCGSVGCKKTENTTEEQYNVFSVEDLGRTFKASDLGYISENFAETPISILGTISAIGDSSITLESDYLTVDAVLPENYSELLDMSKKDFVEGANVRLDGTLRNIDIQCENEEDYAKLHTPAAVDTEESSVSQTIQAAEAQAEGQTQGLDTQETATETTTSVEQYAESLGVSLEDVSPAEAPISLLVRSELYDCRFTASLEDITYIGEPGEYTTPILELTPYTIPDLVTEDELIDTAKQTRVQNKLAELEATNQAKLEAEQLRLNNMTIPEFTDYIKTGTGGASAPEPNPDKYQATPNSYFRISNNAIMGLTDAGKKLTTVVVPDMPIPDDTQLWDDLKAGNTVEVLMFKGKHFTETQVPTPETPAEKRKREFNDLPQPYTTVYSSDLSVKTAALKGCSSIRIIALPYGINSIGSEAFANCTNLAYIRMPVDVFNLEGHIFDGDGKIVSLIMPDNIRTNYSTEVLYNMPGLKNLIFTSNNATAAGIVDAEMYMFKGCTSLERVAISNTVQFDRSRLENAYPGLDNISFKFAQKAETVETTTE